MTVLFERLLEGDEEQILRADFTGSSAQILLRPDQIDEQIDLTIATILERIEAFIAIGSDWTIRQIDCHLLKFARYNPLGGYSYIPTPKSIVGKHAVVNVQNKDNLCFLYSVLAALHPANDIVGMLYKYKPYLHELKVDGLEFPLKVHDIPKFEKLKPDIAIHVLHFDLDNALTPLYHSKFIGRKHVITLLLLTENYLVDSEGNPTGIEDGVKVMTRSHYTLVRNMSALVSDKSKGHQKVYICPNCLHRFTKKRLLESHKPDCMNYKPCRIRFPSNKVKPRGESADDELPDMEEVEQIEDLLQIDSDVRQILQNPPKPGSKRQQLDSEEIAEKLRLRWRRDRDTTSNLRKICSHSDNSKIAFRSRL